ncbi:helix-turn-helix domain-containing protein [Natrinema sp. 1APR25-10V2]|uniref:TrmB family transcriptional regulator n=1 Tax=Natrinema sp. 1APR25-10V2 TaxID=2951081 RepID=UPI0028764EF8|nr:helix-turn-helix domain-containing protein [Natrinema sp. 1APR25-10V2]MDS0474067.1 TrmB family transcriptional regulator [Natrinema sp. 1APR25-10V2]
MIGNEPIQEAIDLLQELGLQEYEARCFVALNQLSTATAKEIHEISEVPRTRVYDAVRVLESKGLVEVRHSNPQVYRAVSIDEATQTLAKQYTDRIESLKGHLQNTDAQETEGEDHVQEVWSLSGHEAIESRTHELIDEAETEIVFVVVDDALLSEQMFEGLHMAVDRDLSLMLGGKTDTITAQLGTELPTVSVFETGLDWLTGKVSDDEVAISRLLLVDRETLLIGTYYPNADNEKVKEQAVFAKGLENGIVVLLRRLITMGLSAQNDSEY